MAKKVARKATRSASGATQSARDGTAVARSRSGTVTARSRARVRKRAAPTRAAAGGRATRTADAKRATGGGTQIAGVGDDAVRAGSGHTWTEWFALLDAAGAQAWKHKDIAAYLYDELECPGWWNQMVAVGYEQARGLRAKNEAASGFQVSCSRTVAAPVSAAWAAWAQEPLRRRWLGSATMAVRKSTPEKTMRISWADGGSSVEVYFFPKGTARSQISVQHRKLASAKDVASMRSFWTGALDRLRRQLEA